MLQNFSTPDGKPVSINPKFVASVTMGTNNTTMVKMGTGEEWRLNADYASVVNLLKYAEEKADE